MVNDETVAGGLILEQGGQQGPPPQPQKAAPADGSLDRLQTGCVLLNRFVIQKFLGGGGMGNVYEAEDLHLHHARIALKTIRSEYVWQTAMRDRFRHEVLLARSISHPNVCPVFEMFSSIGPEGENWFLTMKLLSGETLASRLRVGPLPVSDSLRFAREIAAALDCAHETGVIHRDLKPANIFLESHFTGVRAVVTDFGLARNLRNESWLQDTGRLVGTPAYISPEVLSGEAASPASDVYSFGIILHEMLWKSQPAADVHLDGSAQQRMRKVVLRCVSPDAQLRYPSATAAAEALEKAWNGGRRVTTRRRILWQAAATAAATLVWCEWELRDGMDISDLLSPIPRPRRVAVLPGAERALPVAEASLMNGVVESLGNNLARAEKFERDLFVVPPQMIREEKVRDAPSAAGVFGANLVLSASLDHWENDIKVSLRLADCSTGRVIRHGSITCAADEVYRLPKLVTIRAATLLDIRRRDNLLTPVSKGGTQNNEAYLMFERGRDAVRRGDIPDLEQAIASLQSSVDLDPRFALAYAYLAEAYVAKYQHTVEPAALDLAEDNVRRALILVPDLPHALSAKALVESQRGNYESALAHLKKSVELDKDDALGWLTLAETYQASGNLELAGQTYAALLRERPNLWPAFVNWASLFFDAPDASRAEQLLKRATVAAPNAAIPWRDLGALYLDHGRLDKASDALRRSIQIFPSSGAYTNLGTLFYWQAKFRDAAAAYEKASTLNPRNDKTWAWLGDSLNKLRGRRRDAIDAWRTAARLASESVTLNPRNRDALTRLALYQAKTGDRIAARNSLARAQQLQPPTTEQQFLESLTYESIGDRAMALHMLDECIRNGYSSSEIMQAPELASLRIDPRFKHARLQNQFPH